MEKKMFHISGFGSITMGSNALQLKNTTFYTDIIVTSQFITCYLLLSHISYVVVKCRGTKGKSLN